MSGFGSDDEPISGNPAGARKQLLAGMPFTLLRINAGASYYRRSVTENPLEQTALDQLAGLKKGDPDFAGKIVALYLDTTPSILHELESAASVADVGGLRIATHRLNSASVVVGAVRLAARCNELDRMLRTEPVGDAADLIRIIVEEYRRAEAALRSWCANRQPRRS